MTLVPFTEWRPDVSDFQAEVTSEISNVLPRGVLSSTQILPSWARTIS